MDQNVMVILIVFYGAALLLGVITIAGMWKVFDKAGQPGWAAIVPIFNLYILTKIVNKPGYWTVLMLIPYLNLIWAIWTYNLTSKAFGKDEGFTVGLVLLPFVFWPVLGFGSAQYEGNKSSGDSAILDSELVN